MWLEYRKCQVYIASHGLQYFIFFSFFLSQTLWLYSHKCSDSNYDGEREEREGKVGDELD